MARTQTKPGQPVRNQTGPSGWRAQLTRHWAVFVGAALAMAVGQFVYLSASILNLPLAEHLGVGVSEVVVYNSLMAIAGVPGMMFLGPWLSRRIGVRATMVAGGAWLAACLAAVAFVPDVLTLWVLGAAAGLTFGVVTFMAGSVLVNTWFEAHRGTVMGAAFAVSGLGGIAAGLVLPALVTSTGWQGGFLFLAALVVLCVVLTGLFLIRSTPAKVALRPFGAHSAGPAAGTETSLPGVPVRAALRSPQFAALSLAMVLVGAAHAIELHFAPVMMERGVTLETAGALLSLMALSTVFTNVLLGSLNDRRGIPAAVVVSLGCQALALGGTIAATGPLPLAISTMLFAFGLALPAVLAPILVTHLFGIRDFAAILGPTTAMVPAGLAIGTPLWGLAIDRTGSYTIALAVAAVVTLLAAWLLAWAIRSSARAAAAPRPDGAALRDGRLSGDPVPPQQAARPLSPPGRRLAPTGPSPLRLPSSAHS